MRTCHHEPDASNRGSVTLGRHQQLSPQSHPAAQRSFAQVHKLHLESTGVWAACELIIGEQFTTRY